MLNQVGEDQGEVADDGRLQLGQGLEIGDVGPDGAGQLLAEQRRFADVPVAVAGPEVRPILERMRESSLLDLFVGTADSALRTLFHAPGGTTVPVSDDSRLTASERDRSARLMRVNHAGEVAAQALYRGQALVARDPALRADLLKAAAEEEDHLGWCAARTRALGQDTSRLGPLWYAGSLAIGAAAGLAGDRWSRGFIAETERQVCEHLDGHLERLPAADATSRAVVRRMRADEAAHQHRAESQGAAALPLSVRLGMRAAARVMTGVARYL